MFNVCTEQYFHSYYHHSLIKTFFTLFNYTSLKNHFYNKNINFISCVNLKVISDRILTLVPFDLDEVGSAKFGLARLYYGLLDLPYSYTLSYTKFIFYTSFS